MRSSECVHVVYVSGAAARLGASCGAGGLWLEALLRSLPHGTHARAALDAPGVYCVLP